MMQVEGKIKECQEKLKQWSQVSFGSITSCLERKKAIAEASKTEGN